MSRGQRRPSTPQPFLKALNTAPATQTGAAGQRRPGAPQPFLDEYCNLPHRQEPRASGDQQATSLSRGSENCACHTDRSRAFLEALSTAPATQRGAAGQRRPGAPQPFLQALNTALPHRQEPRASGDQARRNPF